MLLGVDFGSKKSGTTAVAFRTTDSVQILQSKPKQDADVFLRECVEDLRPKLIGIDAPLSLPGRYLAQLGKTDFFYRKADREVNAMSPMFLGGLTARAMAFAASLRTNIEVIEVYPKLAAADLRLTGIGYKTEGNLSRCLAQLSSALSATLSEEQVGNWHAFDACLALLIVERYAAGSAVAVGDEEEGLIWR